jgi:hypothetical protein
MQLAAKWRQGKSWNPGLPRKKCNPPQLQKAQAALTDWTGRVCKVEMARNEPYYLAYPTGQAVALPVASL